MISIFVHLRAFFRLEVRLSQHELERKQKLDKWNKWKEKLRALLDKYRNKLEKVKSESSPKDHEGIKEHLALVKVFVDQTSEGFPVLTTSFVLEILNYLYLFFTSNYHR